MRFVMMILLLAMLAGCASEAPEETEEEIVNKEEYTFQASEGAIDGVLVDDRFRPLELSENGGEGEYQFAGFVLLQETGEQVYTTANGEFQFLNLVPGTYTIRVQVDAHEATPIGLDVRAGEFSELNIVARRTNSDSSFIVTEEYSYFQFCAINVLLPLSDACNALDQSGDSGRIFFDWDWSPYAATLNDTIIEVESNQAGDFSIIFGDDLTSLGAQYLMSPAWRGDYVKFHLQVGVVHPEGGNVPYHVNNTHDLILYINGEMTQEINSALFGLPFTGVGADLGHSGRFMISHFLGAAEVDLETYCIICG